MVVPLTRLAGKSGGTSSAPPGPGPLDSDSSEEALPLLRPAAIPLVSQRPPPSFTAEADEPRDGIKLLVLVLAVLALAAGLWLGAVYLR